MNVFTMEREEENLVRQTHFRVTGTACTVAVILAVHVAQLSHAADPGGPAQASYADLQQALGAVVKALDTASSDGNQLIPGGAMKTVAEQSVFISRPATDYGQLTVTQDVGPPKLSKAQLSVGNCVLDFGPLAVSYEVDAGGDTSAVINSGFADDLWSRDSSWVAIYFRSYHGPDFIIGDIFLVDLRGCVASDTIKQVGLRTYDFSPDGKFFVYSDFGDLWLVRLLDMRRQRLFTGGGYNHGEGAYNSSKGFKNPRWSRDSSFLEIDYYPDVTEPQKTTYKVSLTRR